MKFLVICVSEAAERRQHVFEMERQNLTMETLGLSLGESKALVRGVQEFVVAEQVGADFERRRARRRSRQFPDRESTRAVLIRNFRKEAKKYLYYYK
jgi:hypothetical protein